MCGGEWPRLSPGGRQSSFQEETGVFFPHAPASPGSWPGDSTQPLPELWDKPVATHRHSQAPGPRPKESSTHGQLPWQPRGSFHSPPSRSPLLPALQPTGLCASLERAIKPALVALGRGGDRQTWREASGANPRLRQSRSVKAGGKSLSMQSVQGMSLCLPKRCLCLAVLLLRLLGQVSATEPCPTPCPAQCPETPPTCAPGVRAVLDDRSRCLVCARQRGDSCSETEPCEEGRGLFCDRRADPSARSGICMAIEGDNCVFDGVIYQSGETFQPSCKYQCTCQDGQIGCVPRCDEDLLLPQPDCPAPRKVEVPGECCEKWICDSNETEALGDLHALPAYRTEATLGVSVSDSSSNCIEQTTEWSACSKSCGMGLSTRVTNRNPQCEMVKQTRLCMVRPCEQEHKQPAEKKGKKCLRTTKSLKAIHLQFKNCTSLHAYKPRYCGVCSDGRCCTPHNTKTIQVEFQCSPGQVIKKPVMVIGTCTCHNNCPHNNEAFLQELKPNTGRGNM